MPKYDLEDRTEKFSLDVIRFCKNIPQDTVTRPLISQLVRSATSVGANYREANGANSKKDFANKIYICKKEAKESRYWIGILEKSIASPPPEATLLIDEAQQLVLIFSKIASNSR